jgi:acyl carrier protein
MKEKIILIMQRVFNVDHIADNVSRETMEKWDSLQHLNMVMAMEEVFDMAFEPEEIAAMDSIDKIIAIIEKRKNA